MSTNGVTVSRESTSSYLAGDPVGFEPIVTNLLALATSS